MCSILFFFLFFTRQTDFFELTTLLVRSARLMTKLFQPIKIEKVIRWQCQTSPEISWEPKMWSYQRFLQNGSRSVEIGRTSARPSPFLLRCCRAAPTYQTRCASIAASELQFGQPVHETHPHLLKAGERWFALSEILHLKLLVDCIYQLHRELQPLNTPNADRNSPRTSRRMLSRYCLPQMSNSDRILYSMSSIKTQISFTLPVCHTSAVCVRSLTGFRFQ